MTQMPPEELIAKIIELRIKPVIQSHGGDIRFVSYMQENKTVWVELQGACNGCPNAFKTLKETVESFLRLVLTDDLIVKDINEKTFKKGEEDVIL